ncbi:MAG TPA: Ig-like domain-containing protein [Pseudonocardiaceae bacterium]|nr:Ig-like domain-containing protein [Pseudonocardiaceae bacterium]
MIGLAVATVALAACSSGPSPGGTSTSDGLGGGPQDSSPARTSSPTQAALAAVTITPNTKDVNPTTPIVVKADHGTLSSVTMVNTVKGTHVTGDFSADKTTWTSNEDLGYGATYSVSAVAANTDGRSVTRQSTVSTLSPAKVAYPNMIPAPSSVTSIGVGQPVVFQFDQPVANKKAVQDALTVKTSPSQDGAWYWISDRQVDYRAESFWQAGTTIDVTAKVYGLDFGNGVYGAEDRQVTFHVHDAWIAKADGHTEKMNIYDNGHLVKTMPISMGKQSTPTKVGTHVISSRNQKVQMNSCTYGVCPPDPRAYNETEYWAERISNSGEFVHENPATVGSQGSTNVSHGCINLSEANAEWFFHHLGIGDVVEVTNSGGPKMPIWDMYGDWALSWSTWEAGNA